MINLILSHEGMHLYVGFGLVTGFIDHFNMRLMTTLNYSTTADLHILQITTPHVKSLQFAVSSPVAPW
jgi:hypothetical protein